VLPYESTCSRASVITNLKEKKRKEILNNNLAVLPSHDTSHPFLLTYSLAVIDGL